MRAPAHGHRANLGRAVRHPARPLSTLPMPSMDSGLQSLNWKEWEETGTTATDCS